MASFDTACSGIPPLLSSFVDAFVDFTVGGVFFPTSDPNPQLSSPTPSPNPTPTRFPAPSRLVAIGDLHGDLAKSMEALSMARIADPETRRWTGGASVAVQVGDVLDRGGEELRILYLLHRLKLDAAAAGGALLTLHGNHEVMNLEADFRYITRAGLDEFSLWAHWYRTGLAMKRLCVGLENQGDPFQGIPRSFPGIKKEYWDGFHARIAALRPTGPISTRFLSGNQAVIVVGGSVFVHGGLLGDHIAHGLERINEEVRDWVEGRRGKLSPRYMRGRDAVVWLRRFSEGSECDCEQLKKVLEMIPGVRRMVMGHTIQEDGINGVCENQALRIDVGLSRGCVDGIPEVLEIDGKGELRVLTANAAYDHRRRAKAVSEVEEKKGLALLLPHGGGLKQVEVQA